MEWAQQEDGVIDSENSACKASRVESRGNQGGQVGGEQKGGAVGDEDSSWNLIHSHVPPHTGYLVSLKEPG